MFNHLSNLSNRAVLGILIAVALASSGLSLVVNILNNVDTSPAWWVSWLQNFSTEMFGAFLTFILIELIVGGREKRREQERTTEQEKSRLIRQMRSSINEEAIRAVEELREHVWLIDGSLQKANLSAAHLLKANLSGAYLIEANLHSANLQHSLLAFAHLQRVTLAFARLQHAHLTHANLQRADLKFADLQGSNLEGADLRGANLTHANLEGANFGYPDIHNVSAQEASFHQSTILPDGTHWTPAMTLHRFTDPSHPQFWRSDEPESPAYQRKTDS